MEQIILGIDPGTATTGFGLVKMVGKDVVYLNCGQITTSAKMPLPQRLLVIAKSLRQLIKTYQPNLVGVESLFFARNTSTAILVAEARGVILSVIAEANLPIAEYTPLQVKQALTGCGSADKLQVQKMIKSILKLQAIPGPDDVSDALAIAVCSAFSQTTFASPVLK